MATTVIQNGIAIERNVMVRMPSAWRSTFTDRTNQASFPSHCNAFPMGRTSWRVLSTFRPVGEANGSR
jgi:hypothetical protein